MFRSVDDNHDGALTSHEFAKKIRRFNINVTAEEIDNMMMVLKFPKIGVLTYEDFVAHIKIPDKWGFCSQFNSSMPLGLV